LEVFESSIRSFGGAGVHFDPTPALLQAEEVEAERLIRRERQKLYDFDYDAPYDEAVETDVDDDDDDDDGDDYCDDEGEKAPLLGVTRSQEVSLQYGVIRVRYPGTGSDKSDLDQSALTVLKDSFVGTSRQGCQALSVTSAEIGSCSKQQYNSQNINTQDSVDVVPLSITLDTALAERLSSSSAASYRPSDALQTSQQMSRRPLQNVPEHATLLLDEVPEDTCSIAVKDDVTVEAAKSSGKGQDNFKVTYIIDEKHVYLFQSPVFNI
jgi:hypothetical protein